MICTKFADLINPPTHKEKENQNWLAQLMKVQSTLQKRDNTKRRAGGPCCQMNNMNFPRAQKGWPAGCTTGWASGLHIKAGWWAAQ